MNLIALNLLEATVTLYPANADGTPVLTAPIWTGVKVEDLVVLERWVKSERRATGAAYPKKRPLVAQYELTLRRVWSLQVPTDGGGFQAKPNYYVLDIVWQDEDTSDWHRETYYGVTISSRSRASRDIEVGFTDEQVFDAEYVAPPSGGTGTVPVISATLPMVVQYVDASGTKPLYTYDPATQVFTEASSGATTGRATVDTAGDFAVTFSGAGAPAMQVTAADGVVVEGFYQGVPTVLPRVEFWYGNQRLASLTSAGMLYIPSLVNGELGAADAAGTYALYSSGAVLMATLTRDGLRCAEFTGS